MLIPEYKLAYVPSACTASTTVAYWLKRKYRVAGKGGGQRHSTLGILDDYGIVVSVRNPYLRLPTCWGHAHRKGRPGTSTFSLWLRWKYGRPRPTEGCGGMGSLRTTMSEHLRPLLSRIVFVIRAENLHDDLKVMEKQFGMRGRRRVVQDKNRSVGLYGNVKYSREDAEIIRWKNWEDFQRFGYSPEPLPERLL